MLGAKLQKAMVSGADGVGCSVVGCSGYKNGGVGSRAWYRGCMGILSRLTKSTEHPSRGIII